MKTDGFRHDNATERSVESHPSAEREFVRYEHEWQNYDGGEQ